MGWVGSDGTWQSVPVLVDWLSFLDRELTFVFSRAGKMVLTKTVAVKDAGEAAFQMPLCALPACGDELQEKEV